MIGGQTRHQCSAARTAPTTMTTTTLAAARPTSESSGRRAFVAALGTFALLVSRSDTAPPAAWADVADGNALPKEAQQFANVIQLKTNIKVSGNSGGV